MPAPSPSPAMLTPEERARIAETYRVTVAEDVTVTHCPRGARGRGWR